MDQIYLSTKVTALDSIILFLCRPVKINGTYATNQWWTATLRAWQSSNFFSVWDDFLTVNFIDREKTASSREIVAFLFYDFGLIGAGKFSFPSDFSCRTTRV
jgi:hypothetical protein